MWRQTRKCSENLRDKNCGKWESFFSSQSSDFFAIFYRLPGRVGGGGAKSHSAGAPWWIMKVIWKFEDKCPTFIICSGEGGAAHDQNCSLKLPGYHPLPSPWGAFAFCLFAFSDYLKCPERLRNVQRRGDLVFKVCSAVKYTKCKSYIWKIVGSSDNISLKLSLTSGFTSSNIEDSSKQNF